MCNKKKIPKEKFDCNYLNLMDNTTTNIFGQILVTSIEHKSFFPATYSTATVTYSFYCTYSLFVTAKVDYIEFSPYLQQCHLQNNNDSHTAKGAQGNKVACLLLHGV